MLELIQDNALRMQRVIDAMPDSPQSHELRNALVPILTAVQAMREPTHAPPDVKIHVLVVDDNCAAARALQIALRLLGCEVDIAHDAAEAIAVAEQHPPTVALLDLELAGGDGCELAARLRERAPIGLIAITGSSNDLDRERTREAGFAHHLVKPVDLALLHRTIVSLAGDPAAPDHST